MIIAIPNNSSQHDEYELSEFDKAVLKAVYKEVNGRTDESVPYYQLTNVIGNNTNPETINKSILSLIEKGLLIDNPYAPLGKKTLNGKNICLTLEGIQYLQKHCQ